MSREELLALAGEQAKQITALTAMNEQLATKLAKLEHLLSRNSGNSSMPPSTDDEPGKTPPAARSAVLGRSGPGASSRERRGRTSPGSTGPMTNRIGSRWGAAGAATIWPTP